MAPATMDDQRPDRPPHFPFQVSTMASTTLSDNVLNATETATVTFTFDADYALAPANLTAIARPLSPPLAFPPRHSHPAAPPPAQPGVGQPPSPPATAATQRADCTSTVNNDAGGVLAQSNSFTVDNVRPDLIDFDIPPVIASSGEAVTSFSITFDEPVDASNPHIFSTTGGLHTYGTSSNGGRTWTYQWWPKR